MVTSGLDVGDNCPRGHYLRLDVIAENGPAIRYLAQEMKAECGIASLTIQSAFNDPPGVWTNRCI
jgi:hypothetical protein